MPSPNTQSEVVTPPSFRWRRACSQFLPIVFFAFLCGSCLLLWQYQNRSIVQIGEVEAVNYEVASPAAGIVAAWSTQNGERMAVFSNVTKDQIIVELDDGSLIQNIQTIRRQLNSVKNSTQSKLTALSLNKSLNESSSKSSGDLDHSLAASASGPNAEQEDKRSPSPWQKLAQCTEQALQATSLTQFQLKLRQLESQIRALRISDLSTEEKATQTVSLNQRRRELISEMEALRIELANSAVVSATDLATENISTFSEAERMFFQSATQRCEMLEQQISAIGKSASRLDIRSPVNGQIEKAMVNQYDAVAAGSAVASIVPTEGSVVVVYARETGPVRPFAGMPVVLTSRSNRLLRAETIVSSVGPKIESVPPRQRVNPRVEEWGRPMRIDIPKSFVVEPGALVNVTFDLNRPTR